MTQRSTTIILFCLALLSSALAFVPSTTQFAITATSTTTTTTAPLKATLLPTELFTSSSTVSTITESSSSSPSSLLLSVATLDPTTILSDTLGGLIGSSAILAVPIIAALGIVAVIAYLIVSYANPADEDD